MPSSDPAQKIASLVVDLLAEERQRQNLTYEELGARAGVDRSTIALWDKGERSPGLELILKVCHALGVELSALIMQAEALASGVPGRARPSRPPRVLNPSHFLNEDRLRRLAGISLDAIKAGMEHCHQTIDTIDFQLALHGAKPLAGLIELANLSSMIGNLVAEGIAVNSDGLYRRNVPHAFPDLLPLRPPARKLEVKIALETNRPKGHLPKPGIYLTLRYVLCARTGAFERGKKLRGDTPYIWEAKVGKLARHNFDVSNTEGDSGKTAVIKTSSFDEMALVYFNPDLLPYAKLRRGYPLLEKP